MGIVGGTVGHYWKNRSARVGGDPKRVWLVFPITTTRPRSEAQDGILDGIARITVAGLPGIDSRGRKERDQDDPYWRTQDSL